MSPRCPNCSNSIYSWDNVIVYSTVNHGEQYSYTLNTTFGIYPLILNNPRLVWFDDDHLVLSHDGSRFLWNPSTGDESELNTIFSPLLPIDEYFPSPDRTIAVYQSRTGFDVVSPETGDVIREFEYDYDPSIFSVWSPNNQYFATQPFYDSSQLDIYFHATGDIVTLWKTPEERRIDDLEWSANSRYLSFRERSIYSDGDLSQTFIADMQSQEVYSLCTYFDSSAWSPNAGQLGITLPDDNGVYVFDISDWQLYEIGFYHEGDIVGWREDPE